MKKQFYFLLLTFLLVTYQGYSQEGYGFGINGSVNTVWITHQNMYGDPEIDHAIKVAPEFNLTGGYNFIDILGLWVQAGYSKLGQNYSGVQNINGIAYNTIRDINLNYFTIPVLIKLVAGGDSKFHLMVGPEFAFLMSANQTYTRNGNSFSEPAINLNQNTFEVEDANITDRYVKSDIFLMLDIGADIYVSENLFINVGITINYGFKTIDAPEYRMVNRSKVYENDHNAIIGLKLGLNYMCKSKEKNNKTKSNKQHYN